MRRLNAVDAIGPAWAHTQALMFAPRRWKLMLKLGTVAFFAQMGGCNANLNGANQFQRLPHVSHAALMGLLIGLGVAALAVFLITFYISSRLQFVLFEMVLRRDTWIGPMWRRYGAATRRWIGLKLLFFVVAIVCMVPLIVPIVMFFIHIARASDKTSAGNVGMSFVSILLLFLLMFVVILAVLCVYMLLVSFGLPSMALEGTSLGETVSRVWRLVRSEPWQVLGFVAMHVLLNLALGIGCELFLLVVALVPGIPLGGGAYVLWSTLKHASLAGHVMMVAGWVVLWTIFAVIMFVAAMIVMGGLMVFLEAYALYFLGGRYLLVGEYLEPELVVVAPPPLA